MTKQEEIDAAYAELARQTPVLNTVSPLPMTQKERRKIDNAEANFNTALLVKDIRQAQRKRKINKVKQPKKPQ